MKQRFLASIAGAALVALAGCGGIHTSQCGFFLSGDCEFDGGDLQPALFATVVPSGQTVQVGSPATFSVSVDAAMATYQWQRSTDGGASYADIAGATAPSYTLPAATLPDDGTLFVAIVTGGDGSTGRASGRLRVSAMPPVVFQDGEFLASDWTVAAVAGPASGPAHSEEAATSGGSPGAYRRMTHEMPAGASSLRVLHSAAAAVYDPSTAGAVYVIDYSEDCIASGTTSTVAVVVSSLLLEQGDRKYRIAAPNVCSQPVWLPLPPGLGLGAANLQLIDGPACGVAEACPDFSAGAMPLRFGYVRETQQTDGAAATVVHGIDNWKVVVWRR